MKKLISIGIALALLTMAVVPAAVGADPYGEGTYEDPPTYAKVPFAMIASGFALVGNLMGPLEPLLAGAGVSLPIALEDVGAVTDEVAGWTYGPLSWSVDMMGWGMDLGAGIVGAVGPTLGLPEWIGDVISDIACGLFTPWNEAIDSDTFSPCP